MTLSSFSQAAIHYKFQIEDAAHHLARVDITFSNVATRTLVVKLPVWRSGRYEILDLSKNITDFSVTHTNGDPVNWHKTDKNTWNILLNRPGTLKVSYQVYANNLKQRVAHIDRTHAFLDASGVFMFAPAMRDEALTVDLTVPDHWASRSGMDQPQPHQFVAANYDELVDSPIETGEHEFLSFEVDGLKYEIVIWGEGNHDIQDLQQQITALHPVAKDIWGEMPFKRYVFMYHVGDGLRGATEHVNSTIIQQGRFNFSPRKPYLKVLSTTAHEFVHTWNVKAYRPQGLAPYNYSQENYSDLMWMAEGITSYYDELFLIRAGIYETKEFFEKLAEILHKHQNNPGRLVESVAQSSFDTWMKENKQRNHNAAVSIYQEGLMAGWLLDKTIREDSDQKQSLDDLQRLLYERHRNIDVGYHSGDVKALLKELTNQDYEALWDRYIEGTEVIDVDELLFFYGLQKQENKAAQDPWFGWQLDRNENQVVLKMVDRNGPAWSAGLTAGDQLLAINGIQVTADQAQAHLNSLMIGEPYELHFFSAGRLETTRLKPSQAPFPAFDIVPVEKPSRAQQKAFSAWAGQALPE